MSSFYQLMMRKKEEIMYATIKGSLTESPEGVFSGFSSSNYLELQEQIDISQPFEINIKVDNFSATGSSQFIFGLLGNINFGFYLGTSATGISGQYGSSYWTGVSTNMTVGSPFTINLKGNGTTLTATVIHDNTTQTSSKVIEDIGLSGNFTIRLGKRTDSQPFTSGAINLPQCYLKLGSTKYKLQAVVGYTIVGSPTITDGVVSGFSSSDYLQLGAVPDINQDFEMQCKFTTGNTIENGGIISSNNYYMNGFRITNSKVAFSVYFNGAVKNCTVDTNIATNTTYIAYAKRVGNNINIVLYDENKVILSTNNLSVDDYTISLPAFSYLGYGLRSGTFNGSIDLNNNNTYIKLDNKLWFNGQQA